jgi:hypothetical protein
MSVKKNIRDAWKVRCTAQDQAEKIGHEFAIMEDKLERFEEQMRRKLDKADRNYVKAWKKEREAEQAFKNMVEAEYGHQGINLGYEFEDFVIDFYPSKRRRIVFRRPR